MIRVLTSDDLPAVLALNNAHAMEVNALTADALAALVASAAYARVVDGGRGFLLALSERTPVQGPITRGSWRTSGLRRSLPQQAHRTRARGPR
jgi:predicted GNAT superfamily acetyltransferase